MASARHSDGPVSSWEKMANVVSWALRAHSKLQALVKDRNSRVPSGLFKEEKLWGFGALGLGSLFSSKRLETVMFQERS